MENLCGTYPILTPGRQWTSPVWGSKPERSRLLPWLKSAWADIPRTQRSPEISPFAIDSNARAAPLQRSALGAYTGGDSEPLTPKREKAYGVWGDASAFRGGAGPGLRVWVETPGPTVFGKEGDENVRFFACARHPSNGFGLLLFLGRSRRWRYVSDDA